MAGARDAGEAVEARLREEVEASPAPLRAVVAHALAPPAKRLRPRVAILAFEACGGRAAHLVMPAAIAMELFHAATLLVDDIVDEAARRRGRPSAHVAHGARATLLAAGHLMNRAQRLAAADDALPEMEPDAVRVLRNAVDAVLRAEALAMQQGGAADEDQWIEIASGKTGALFMAAAESGARRAGAHDAQVRAMRRYGMLLGVAFQAADDLLDVEGDPALTGKPRAADASAPNLARAVGVEKARAAARRFAEDALAALADVPPSAARDALAALAREAVERER